MMQMQSELFLPSWPTFNFPASILYNDNTPYNQENTIFSAIEDCDFPSSGDSSMNSSNSYVQTMFPKESLDLKNMEHISSETIAEILEWINGSETQENTSSPSTMEEDDSSPCLALESSQDMSILLPRNEMEEDEELSLIHLLKAYAEAMKNGEKELTEVILKSMNEKSSPLGNTMERVVSNLFQSKENQGEYIRQQSIKNFIAAFTVAYQSLPNGKIAHFTANSAILESVPNDVGTVHIVDFDMGEGIQWPLVIEALSRKQKTLKLTSIKADEECNSSYWDFGETKKRLQNHALLYGLKILIEEKGIKELANELTRMKNREFLVFNCMVGLPHMGRRRPRIHVTEFLKFAEDLLGNFAGIVILGDGGGQSLSSCSSYTLHFDKLLRHYKAQFESLERNFPVYLAEARIALESLFLAPFMCFNAWSEDWEEMKKEHYTRGLKGRKVSQESLAEAKDVVNEKENLYRVKIEGVSQNEMVLQWKETPLVRVSIWT